MTTRYWHYRAVFILIINVCLYASCQHTDLQLCQRCNGTLQNATALGRFCTSVEGLVDGRCCLRNDNPSEAVNVIGLDFSNCNLKHVDDLQEASTAIMIDLSLNPIFNLSDSVFQGFIQLNYINLPANLGCPGGNASWEKVEVKGDSCLCEGQKNVCNQTGQMSLNCPENSLCAPYGPGLFECSCEHNFHGYKCLREGEFPLVLVFGPLAASTVGVSILLWVTQRRKAKSV
ncbi:all-trans retinoic acid-induced differentiation factor [Hypomesus transpacificus]|uniref:all-trans retinoic acid-induced differentiation factor n=1 Tax=Hypomesus transpacificus TaxID=137520 RepID=UPI001F073320|nr:all-trans retinoic acid-induced differentiation factor [Hypomesus transpacificus]